MDNNQLETHIREWNAQTRTIPYQLKPRHILLEVMAIEDEPSQHLIEMDGTKARGRQRIYSYGKVMAAGPETEWDVNTNDLAVLPARLAKVSKSREMELWEINHGNERRSDGSVPAPAKQFEGMLMDWQDKYHFPLDRFCDPSKMEKADAFTFLIPEGFIDGAITEYDLIGIIREADLVPEEPVKIDPAMTALKQMKKTPKIILPQA